MSTETNTLKGQVVAVFESRRANEMARLVERHGGVPIVAPTMKEVPLVAGPEVRAFAEALRRRELDAVLLLTGVGTRALVAALADVMAAEEFRDALLALHTFARGPKTVAALKELGVRNYIVAREPFTWMDLLKGIEEAMPVSGARFALQQYGVPHLELTSALEAKGARVMQVPVYRWQLPDDLAPIDRAIDAMLGGEVRAALFTSAQQVDHLLQVATMRGLRDALLRALTTSMVVGSIGPTCTERLSAMGIVPDLEPEHGHMGHLVKELAERIEKVQKSQP